MSLTLALLLLDAVQLVALALLGWGLWTLLDRATLQPFAGKCGCSSSPTRLAPLLEWADSVHDREHQ